MSRRRKLPSYRLHKPTNQAVVTLSGRDFYLGRHGTRASYDAYDRVTSEWLAAGRTVASADPHAEISVAELANAFRKAGAIPASHLDAYKAVIKLTVQLYGTSPVSEFGPLALKVVRERMVTNDWKRHTVNQRVHNLRRIFRWGVEHELVPPATLHALAAVEGLRAGKTAARESEPVQPIAEGLVEKVLVHASPTIQTMARLQLLTGARAGEICEMRICDIDRSEATWIYRPAQHKTQHHGKTREIAIGPKAQELLKTYLLVEPQDFIFSPARAEQMRRDTLSSQRRTALSYGNRPGTARKRNPAKKPGHRYETPVYRRAIYNACDAAFPPPAHLKRLKGETTTQWRARLTAEQQAELGTWRAQHRWHPHQLRHTFASKVRKEFGLEHAQRVLGHSHANVTERYAKVAIEKSLEVATAIG